MRKPSARQASSFHVPLTAVIISLFERQHAPLLALLFIMMSGCGEPPDKTIEELDILETTFRYQFDHQRSGLRYGGYYLAILYDDRKFEDPDDEFLKRFAGNKPPVKKVSECEREDNADGVWDKKSGARGIIFKAGAIKWVSKSKVEVSGGYYTGMVSASGNTYHLTRRFGKWRVTKEVLNWVS